METATLTSPLTRNGHRADSSFQAIQTETNHRAPIEESNRKEPRLKPIAITVLAALAAAAFAFAAHHWWVVGRFIESTDDAYINGDVTVIAPKVAGFVESISVKDNQQVNAGDLLLKLDGRDYAAALAKSEASVAFQKASLTNLDATGLLQQAMVLQARASVTAADAETARAGNDQARAEKLRRSGALSVQECDKADADYKEAAAESEKARAALIATQRQLEVVSTEKQKAQASLQQAIAEREMARLNLSYTELRAPIDGLIGNRSAQVGAYATIGSQLISLVPTHGLWIDANFKESQLPRIHPGSPATVTVDSIPGKTFRGHVISIAPATGAQFSVLPPENATGNFTKIVQRITVRIAPDDEGEALGQLRPGLSVIAEVNTISNDKPGTSDRAGL